MLIITSLGSSPFHDVVISIIVLGVSLRKGLILAHLVIWTSVLTDFLKLSFSLPRPYQVDAGVSDLERFYTTSGLDAHEAKGSYDFIIKHLAGPYGPYGDVSYGFPSGHVSASTTVFGGMSFLFESRAIRAASIPVIMLVAVSRMYLGRHFLGDVIGGLVLGTIILFAAARLLIRPSQDRSLFDQADFRRFNWRTGILFFYLIAVPFLLLTLNARINPDDAGRLLGINAALLLVLRKGIPSDSGSFVCRAARVILGILLFAVTRVVLGLVIDRAFETESSLLIFLQGAVSSFMLIWATVGIGSRIGLYKRGSRERTDTLST
ncbi:MAG TPA: phosphatase PAP2 family protein [Blastocatellia bacterium]|nr:phosphatase PAP2 family protein [Blastocatellia bacterium]